MYCLPTQVDDVPDNFVQLQQPLASSEQPILSAVQPTASTDQPPNISRGMNYTRSFDHLILVDQIRKFWHAVD